MKKKNPNLVVVIRHKDRLTNSELINVCGGTNIESDGECTECNCWCGNSNDTTKKDELSTK